MKIILIGAGNLATHLAKALLKAGHDILQVYSRTQKSASQLTAIVGGEPIVDIRKVRDDADLYIFSVKDSVLCDLVSLVCKGKEDKVFLHTAGSMPMSVFDGVSRHYGVLYPMQTFSKAREVDFSAIPCFVEANDASSHQVIEEVARQISSKVYELSSEKRKYLHLAAVFACNFVNHCYALSQKVLEEQGIPFEVMLPLVDETARKVHELSPRDAQTGPAVRYDENVIRSQALLLENQPLLKDIYERMSLSIHEMATKR